jgi:hypothetical protein
MDEKTAIKFNIDLSAMKAHAPIVYNVIQDYYSDIGKLTEVLNVDSNKRQELLDSAICFGMLPNKDRIFEEAFIENDEFRTCVVFHLGLKNIFKRTLAWTEYVTLLKICQKAFFTTDVNTAIDTMMLKLFNVDPRILPKVYMARIMKVEEFNAAVAYIHTRLNDMEQYGEKYDDYNQYFEYVKKRAIEITEECNEQGYYGTQEIERFTCACISSIMGMPIFSLLYNVNSEDPRNSMPIEMAKKIQKTALYQMHGYSNDEEEDDEDDDDDPAFPGHKPEDLPPGIE